MPRLLNGFEYTHGLICNIYCNSMEEVDERIRVMEELGWQIQPDTVWGDDASTDAIREW